MPKVDFGTFEEFTKFIVEIDDIVYKSLFITLYFTGCRLGECLSLTRNDLKDNYIDINKIYHVVEKMKHILFKVLKHCHLLEKFK